MAVATSVQRNAENRKIPNECNFSIFAADTAET